MSPELNGNPPSVTKRKKNREKKLIPSPQQPQQQLNPLDFKMTNCNNYFPSSTTNSTNNYHHHHPLSIPEISAYYSYYPNSPAEPMSLPVYPLNYQNYYGSSNPNLNFMSPAPKPSMMPVNGGADGGGEYLSLPVGNLDHNGDVMGKRRYSDPGLPNDSDEEEEEDDDGDSGNSIGSKIIEKLTHQVNALKESNRKLNREMMEMKMELNLLKQQVQQQQHTKQTYDREYEPGMLADIIREVRDAARVREDALLARVKHMIEEKQLSLNHLHLVGEKNRNNDRISKLEEQLKNLSVTNTSNTSTLRSSEDANNVDHHGEENGVSTTARQVLELEREALELRRELQDTRAKKEESDQKLLQLDKKLSSILRRNDISPSDISDDGKTNNSIDSLSVTTTSSSISQIVMPPRVTLSGPVTDL